MQTTLVLAAFAASAVLAAKPTGTLNVAVDPNIATNQCIGGSIQVTISANGVPLVNPDTAGDETQIVIAVTSASATTSSTAALTQSLRSLLNGASSVNQVITIPQGALVGGNGYSDAVVQASIYYASQPTNNAIAVSSTPFSVWQCDTNARVAGSGSLTYTAPKSLICAGDVISYNLTLQGVPAFDPKYGPTYVRIETEPAADVTENRGPYLDSANVLPPVVLTANTLTGLSGQYVVPRGYSGINGFYFKAELNYFGSNTTNGVATNPATFTSIQSPLFNVGDVYVCGPTKATTAPATTATATVTTKSGADKALMAFGAVAAMFISLL
ncbi:hypothetical protein HDU79_006423 [Rhizoclosmatium sp. JEL0117]|nr:hypothetical protein HDU79_006423 [Rhizoclosmatium sp. JEL0117]